MTERIDIITSYEDEANRIVRDFGTSNEIERLEAGVLPEGERDRIVSDVIFAPILELPIRRKAKEEGILRFAIEKGLAGPHDKVNFQVIDEEELDTLEAVEWETLKFIKQELPLANVKTFEVVCTCGQYMRRLKYAKVELTVVDRVRRIDVALNPSEHQKNRSKNPVVMKRR